MARISKRLIFDTETTGLLPQRGQGVNPHLVQLGALLMVDRDILNGAGDSNMDQFREAAHFHCLIRPDGWEIPAEATRIHHITTEDCMRSGLDLVDALSIFREMANIANEIIAHNYEFDSCVLDLEYRNIGQQGWLWQDERQFCTMKAATQVVKAQGTNARGSFTKYPKLTEAHQFFIGKPFDGEHTAIGDVRACWSVYQALQTYAQKVAV